MDRGNQTSISEFLLLGLSDRGEQRQLLFMLFLWMYLRGVLGSLLIILAIRSDRHLHTPMYFFLTNLSLADVCFLSTTVPKMLVNIQTHNKSISYAGCLAQMYFFILFAALDHFLLTGMAYDRYVAICHPLPYPTIMGPRLCALMVAGSWITSSLHALTHTLMVLRISFCADNKIHHFFCEPIQIIKLSCTDPLINEILLFVLSALLGLGPLTGLLFSYTRIFSTILRIPSAGGRFKAFSTCGSHLSVVSLFYGTSLWVYFSPRSTHKARKDSIASVMYSVVTPMLNPFIYSLRNKDMKGALRKFISRNYDFFQRLSSSTFPESTLSCPSTLVQACNPSPARLHQMAIEWLATPVDIIRALKFSAQFLNQVLLSSDKEVKPSFPSESRVVREDEALSGESRMRVHFVSGESSFSEGEEEE
ncbi:olfactory receptor 7G3-like [Tachyglossus aculeatus]|uniref:olfactory receptor 7G3-like n=1 Tax=Tachyglossus aculeatus TaxID=9261 RepID=UPI0018F36F94|nr:olfactory receptor 7G3-like [Tachyglossus aculeatus]